MPLAMNTPGGGQVLSAGVTWSLMLNSRFGKWLLKAAPFVASLHDGERAPGCVVPSIHVTVSLVVTRFASFCSKQLYALPLWSTWVARLAAPRPLRPSTLWLATFPQRP